MKLSKNFLWGGAMSAHQMEGGFKTGGKGLSVADVMSVGDKNKEREITDGILEGVYYPNHEAIDFYSNYKEDIAMFHELGLKCLRTSIAWSRIYPNGDEEVPNEEGFQFYDNVFEELLKYDIKPVITLSHFEMPYHLAKVYGGWHDRRVIDYFVKFAVSVMERYKDKVKYWMTFNEINNQKNVNNDIFGWTCSGVRFSEFEKPEEAMYQCAHHELVASAKVVKIGHQINPDFEIGCMCAMVPIYPYSCTPEDIMLANSSMHDRFLFADVHVRGHYPNYAWKEFAHKNYHIKMEAEDLEILAEGCVDYIGLSYYMSTVVQKSSKKDVSKATDGANEHSVDNPYIKKSDWGWAIDPIGLRYALNIMYERYELPLFLVENGFGAIDEKNIEGAYQDSDRIQYLAEHVHEMEKAILFDGVEVIGYTPWGCIDLVSFTTGEMEKRYGFIHVDKDNLGKGSGKRTKKNSFDWYRKLIANDGEL